jgi:hypothetical protein
MALERILQGHARLGRTIEAQRPQASFIDHADMVVS